MLKYENNKSPNEGLEEDGNDDLLIYKVYTTMSIMSFITMEKNILIFTEGCCSLVVKMVPILNLEA